MQYFQLQVHAQLNEDYSIFLMINYLKEKAAAKALPYDWHDIRSSNAVSHFHVLYFIKEVYVNLSHHYY
jgi:hypothetical protein